MTKSQLIDKIHKKRNSDFTKQQIAAITDDIFLKIKEKKQIKQQQNGC